MMKVTDGRRQAIRTKFVGPSDVRGSRVIASCDAGRVILSWDHRLNQSENHAAAVTALCKKLEWDYHFVGGGNPDGTMSWVDITDLG